MLPVSLIGDSLSPDSAYLFSGLAICVCYYSFLSIFSDFYACFNTFYIQVYHSCLRLLHSLNSHVYYLMSSPEEVVIKSSYSNMYIPDGSDSQKF